MKEINQITQQDVYHLTRYFDMIYAPESVFMAEDVYDQCLKVLNKEESTDGNGTYIHYANRMFFKKPLPSGIVCTVTNQKRRDVFVPVPSYSFFWYYSDLGAVVDNKDYRAHLVCNIQTAKNESESGSKLCFTVEILKGIENSRGVVDSTVTFEH